MRTDAAHYTSLVKGRTGDQSFTVLRVSSVGGGSINDCCKLETDKGIFFLKENDAKKFPGMFEAEQKGLALLRSANAFVIPEAIATWEENGTSYLLLRWLERGAPGKDGWWNAGNALGRLHKNSAKQFGLDHDNYIGSLPQSNKQHDSWEEFFTLERMLPQLRMARDARRVDPSLVAQAERFCAKAGEIFPEEQPALLHGDLWGGNFFFSNEGPAVFDPAVYYGHREMDLAMSKLFGGFDADFYSGYEEEFPLEKSWKQRVDLCNVYPLLVHVNLFGGGYVDDVKTILRKF